ncbi:MAG: fluoride efflux transporter CrcB [Xanthomonadales bacterium]|nr:fluoride efflux transporter CrcB [Xanthomonadales bacterium]
MSLPLAASLALVVAGGALGGALRFALGHWLARRLGVDFPWPTLLVNLSGALLIGLLAGSLPIADDGLRLALLVGLLGSYTTVSALAVEFLALLRSGRRGQALSYLVATVVPGMAAVWLGLRLAAQ